MTTLLIILAVLLVPLNLLAFYRIRRKLKYANLTAELYLAQLNINHSRANSDYALAREWVEYRNYILITIEENGHAIPEEFR
jgi:hypothetical protein